MKKLIIIFSILFLMSPVLFTSCENILETDSDRILTDDDNTLDSAHDSLYSILGILTLMQEIGDRYVLFGELRGDLMDVNENYASPDLIEINNFQVSEDNSYLGTKDFYAIINNCNYFIQNVDTALTSYGQPLLKKEFAVAKTIRAWTYLQLATNFGKVTYFTEPLLTVEDTEKEYPEIGIRQLIDLLIADLEPCAEYGMPEYGTIYTYFNTRNLLIPVKLMLGDLYLWRGASVQDYERAATYYREVMIEGGYVIDEKYQNYWVSSAFLSQSASWSSIFSVTTSNTEMVSLIAYTNSTSYGKVSDISNLTTLNYMSVDGTTQGVTQLTASPYIQQLWDEQVYAYGTAPIYTSGDLRKEYSFYTSMYSGYSYIYKYSRMSYAVCLYRAATLYLRYAEAVNRAGKPGLAFAVLKYGLSAATVNSSLRVPRREIENGEAYIDFNNEMFDESVGIHSRGLGNSAINEQFIIDYNIDNLQDSILYVEDMIVQELALETAFEGNRFQDLMRVSYHRNDPAYLAKAVAMKHQNKYDEIVALLSDERNWYLPVKNSENK